MNDQAGTHQVVVVDRKVTGQEPPYHLAAITLCSKCRESVWLGTATLHAVQDGAVPLCIECAAEIIPPDSERIGKLVDRPRRKGLRR